MDDDPVTPDARPVVDTEDRPAPPPDEPPRSFLRRYRNSIEWIVVIAGAVVVALVIKTFLFQAFYIPSTSMTPTLQVGDRVLVNKLSYDFHDVNRKDIVVFARPSVSGQTVDGCNGGKVTIPPQGSLGEGNVEDLIKRVIGLPGDTVEQRSGKIYVNGQQVDEPYLAPGTSTPPFTFSSQCIKVPQGDVFVLGDNRPNSDASNMFGPIPESLIVGRAFIRVWPLSDFGLL